MVDIPLTVGTVLYGVYRGLGPSLHIEQATVTAVTDKLVRTTRSAAFHYRAQWSKDEAHALPRTPAAAAVAYRAACAAAIAKAEFDVVQRYEDLSSAIAFQRALEGK